MAKIWDRKIQWLMISGRVLDSRPRGGGFKPHWRPCIVSLSKTDFSLLSTGSTREDQSRHNWKIVDWDIKNQIKHTKNNFEFTCTISNKWTYTLSMLVSVSVSINQLLSIFQCGGNHILKGATFKGKNMLPIGSIFFPLRVAPMWIENDFKGH